MDALTDTSRPDVLWSRVNSAEAQPGVLTPMTWSFYGRTLEINARKGFRDLGILTATEAAYPAEAADRMLGCFHGRLTVNVDVVRQLFSGLPGTDGDSVERGLLGEVWDRPRPIDHRTRPAVYLKAPPRLLSSSATTARLHADTHRWWTGTVGPGGVRTGQDPYRVLEQALVRFGRAVRQHGPARLTFQAVAAELGTLADRAGDPDAAASLLAGAARTEESAVADDLWLLANDHLGLPAFLATHGYHAPDAGELASRSWREDPAPLERILDAVQAGDAPARRRARATAARGQVVARFLAALPPTRRGRARLLLRLGPVTARALERTKTSFVIAGDVGRAAVRDIGTHLVTAGHLEAPEHAFHLFADELLDRTSPDRRGLAEERRALREQCERLELPKAWIGQPCATEIPAPGATPATANSVTGLGVSPGLIDGRVRVLRSATAETAIDPGDILVCPTTDPSWLGLMTVAGAMVIDIGAMTSHGAIVARELGVPCVIGTGNGTTTLRDGDRVRVDGSRGVVTVIARAAPDVAARP